MQGSIMFASTFMLAAAAAFSISAFQHHVRSDNEVVLSLVLCRLYVEKYHINDDLRKLLPHGEGKPVEKPAERALRERM